MRNPISAVIELFRPQNTITTITIDELVKRLNRGMATTSGINVSPTAAEGLAAMAACVRVLSRTIAHLPLNILRRSGDRRDLATDLGIYYLLHNNPNGWQTSFQWRMLGMRDLLYRGNWYNLKVKGTGGKVIELIRLHPDRTKPKQDPRTLRVIYEHQRSDGSTVTYQRDEIFHVWIDSDDGVLGLDPIQIHRNSIGDGIAIRDHGSLFFRNAARLSGILTQDKGVKFDSKESRDAFLKDFDEAYSGNNGAHRTGLLPDGIKFEPVSINMENAQWIEARKQGAREIYGIMGVPPHKGGDLADATYSNVENENLSFVIDSITPITVCIEQAINRDLLNSDPALYARMNISALLRGDFKSRQEGLNIQRRAGVINANEWRGLEDLNPRTDSGGDEYIVEQNMREQNGKEKS